MRAAAPERKRPESGAHDPLKQTQRALAEAQKTIAEQQQREKELKKLLELQSLVESGDGTNALLEAKTQALNNIHSQKVRSLMKSIHQLQEQVSVMKAQDNEHRRSALIQSLRKKQREQDLLIDVLKEALATKAPEFQDSGPKRFRPKTREELELEFLDLDKKYKRVVQSLKSTKAAMASNAKEEEASPQDNRDAHEDDDEAKSIAANDAEAVKTLQEEVDRLRIAIASKDVNLQAQLTEIETLQRQLAQLTAIQDKCDRAKQKYAASKEALGKIEHDSIQLIQQKEKESEARAQAEAELAFFKEAHANDVAQSDREKLDLLERIKAMHAHEIDLQTQLEDQQKKWCLDRSNLHAQLRAFEKQLQAAHDEAQAARAATDTMLQAKESMSQKIVELNDALAAATAAQAVVTPSSAPGPSAQELAVQHVTWQQAIDERDLKLRALDKQVLAAKLLARQSKKEKEQLLQQIDKLRTLLADAAPKTDASALLSQLKAPTSSTDASGM
ncbi:hypothetical protein SPRG_03657 [Saprolegnia parasitica CBS 223.65]|uniref:Uncharacterized protein n=1 Tax=Saprolegnia parasitica (strain CBS 223.65) TaxID=695850 RepID=A0A067CY78_SAPPC|nr:hypothetical protein SPRG_03657 [Saprolegnia parasitica CBS 223.65]KDO31737.1 hypothetical protein SPRG_03657 [Saprolegnia parasitica CBS 223.65]|eukprot:XP_012197618.1 hypothetical protein SPRG_03657 [Saprolegnia parasitica CBS 223.65]